MLKLRKILLCNSLYKIILLITIIVSLFRLVPNKSIYTEKSTQFTGTITKIEYNDQKTIIEAKNKEKVIIYYDKKIKLNLGDKIKVIGEFTYPNKNTSKYLFNYQKYLQRKNIHFIIKSESIEVLSKNKLLIIKEKIIKNISSNKYLNTFILGDKSKIDDEVIKSFRKNGISHLFAISGMHITLLSSIIERILKRIFNEEKIFKITTIILLIYLLLTGLSPSILRGVLFYIIFRINSIYYFNVEKNNLFILILSISLLINPNYIFDIGFLYSYQISYTLLNLSNELKGNYLLSLLKVSIISLISSIPITLYNFYEINLLSIFYNIIFVPYISLIIFPLTLIILLIRPLEPIYVLLTNILEKVSIHLSKIGLTFVFKRLNITVYLLYFFIFFIYLKTKKKTVLLIYFIILIIHFLLPIVDTNNYVKILDVGQGDSILIKLNKKIILIDTGTSYNEGDLFNNTINNVLKSHGINKIDTLIITHGDKDHAGEASYLLDNIKVKRVIFNTGKYNYLEKKIIKKLEKHNIKYYKDIDELKVDNNIIYFLNTKDYHNENDNSIVLYLELNNYKFLFMGDASKEREKDIIENYDLGNIDFLKVGHHGSDTSSSKEFIENIKPKYCLISVGKNNRFNHPKESVLKILEDCKTYRTDIDGTIDINFVKEKYIIKTEG